VLCDLERCATNFFLSILDLAVKFSVFSTDSFHGILESLYLQSWIFIIGKNVLFLNLKCPWSLRRTSFFVDKLAVLSLEKLISVWAFAKLLIDKLVFSCESLDIFSKFSHFLCFELSQLCLLIDLLSKTFALLAKRLDLLFTSEKCPLVVVFFANNHAHLMLHVAELETLLLQVLPCCDKLFGFLV